MINGNVYRDLLQLHVSPKLENLQPNVLFRRTMFHIAVLVLHEDYLIKCSPNIWRPLWTSGKVSALGPEGSRFETRFYNRSALYGACCALNHT
ncbi:hypothetical protein AVEN_13102-1 [Araneus ventricosus]|uniref:Uncharacterized protein n=1 Tax=Araneus ventricosus TaxID=182803 RepID=A0A4Y2K9Q5_ARAVE|nr:hypothetical protein AVEN_13102-1 [Araneus ventricosus]